jgi:hypothetical protein
MLNIMHFLHFLHIDDLLNRTGHCWTLHVQKSNSTKGHISRYTTLLIASVL